LRIALLRQHDEDQHDEEMCGAAVALRSRRQRLIASVGWRSYRQKRGSQEHALKGISKITYPPDGYFSAPETLSTTTHPPSGDCTLKFVSKLMQTRD
jgi:hypothetical protein